MKESMCSRWHLRLIVLLILFFPLTLSAAQGRVTVKGQSITLRQAIKIIESSSNFKFFFNPSDLDALPSKNLDCEGEISDVLKEVFAGSGISYVIMGDDIILKLEKKAASTQQKKVEIVGGVVDARSGESVVGATVRVKDVNSGVITDMDGKFTIKATPGDVLVISYIGYETKEVKVVNGKVLLVELVEDAKQLEEVVVTAYGSGQKKASMVGSVQAIRPAELQVPSASLSNSFAGRLAGVIAVQRTGQPGADGSDFYIRGISTFGGRTTPLILLDDVEISVADLNYVPAENIESFSILKDASATAIYGARGANGVMIISTKGGDYNMKTKVNVSAENSFNIMSDFPEFVDGPRYMELYNEADLSRNPNKSKDQLLYSDRRIQLTRDGVNPYVYPNVDWQDVIFKKMTMTQRANINVSGGGTKVKYYMSLNVSHDSGLLNTEKAYSWNNNINIMNYTFQNNISYKLTPTTTIRMNMNAQIRQNKGPNINSADLFKMILTTTPVTFPATYPAQPGDTYIRYGSDYQSSDYLYPNPYAQMMTSYKEQNANTLNTVIKVEQDFGFVTKGLKANIWVNFKNWSSSSYNRSITPYLFRAVGYSEDSPLEYDLERIQEGADYIAQSDIARSSDQTFEFQGNISYNRQFGLHNVGGMLMYRQREYRSDVLPNRNQGVSGRFTYDYGQRYLAEINFGYNGTERLAKKKRFGFFPAMSLGWVISNEKFFEPLKNAVNNLKVRASYGLVGSDDLAQAGGSYYLYIDKLTDNKLDQIKWTFGESMNHTLGGPEIAYYANLDAVWEKAKKFDIGVDMTLFDHWNITIDYFYDKRYDIFMERQSWPNSLGYGKAKPWGNVGKMDNKGVEFSLNYHKNFSKDLGASFQANLTYNKNKLVYKDEPDYPTIWKSETGKPYSRLTGYISEGLFQSQEEIDNSPEQMVGNSTPKVGDIKYRDLNGDGKITEDDQCMISKYGSVPRLQYGFGGTINYKKFDFGIFFSGSALRSILINGLDPFLEGNRIPNKNVLKFIADNHWSVDNPNPNAEYPRLGLTTGDIGNNTVNSTYWLRNGSFLRLKNLEIGYKIPYGRIYVSGANLLRFSPFDLWDPELSSWNSYPLQRTVNVGLQLNF